MSSEQVSLESNEFDSIESVGQSFCLFIFGGAFRHLLSSFGWHFRFQLCYYNMTQQNQLEAKRFAPKWKKKNFQTRLRRALPGWGQTSSADAFFVGCRGCPWTRAKIGFEFNSFRFDSIRLDRIGLNWIGLDWIALAWLGLACSTRTVFVMSLCSGFGHKICDSFWEASKLRLKLKRERKNCWSWPELKFNLFIVVVVVVVVFVAKTC